MTKHNASCNNVAYCATCCTYVKLVKSLKGVECDIEYPVPTTFIMVHHYLACTIVKTDMPAFVAFIYRETAIPFLRFVRSR